MRSVAIVKVWEFCDDNYSSSLLDSITGFFEVDEKDYQILRRYLDTRNYRLIEKVEKEEFNEILQKCRETAKKDEERLKKYEEREKNRIKNAAAKKKERELKQLEKLREKYAV